MQAEQRTQAGDGWAELKQLAEFYGPNAGYVLELYERYLHDPSTVDAADRVFFERWRPVPPPPAGRVSRAAVAAGAMPMGAPPPPPVAEPDVAEAYAARLVAVRSLATAIREYGHKCARLDPLGTPPPGDPELDPAAHGLREQELDLVPASAVGGPAAQSVAHAQGAMARLRQIYCGTSGYDLDQVQDAAERAWLRDAIESDRFRPPHDPINEQALLERLTEVGAFERFLQRTFPGQTRFSIEGTGMLIPMLDEIIGAAAEAGTRALLLGMAHRGRLNVLAHVLHKSHVEILAEFMRPSGRAGVAYAGSSGEAFSGDVKYHLGARHAYRDGEEVEMAVTLVPNPSHLEYVNPVVEGMTRAAITRAAARTPLPHPPGAAVAREEGRDRPGPPLSGEGSVMRDGCTTQGTRPSVQPGTSSLALLIHGDAAFPGQGVVAETLNLSHLPGYSTGGSIHIIVNNQLGFTVEPRDGRSTLYASDLAKGFEIPIVHVNADDPVACLAAARLAHAYREQFGKDFLIDLVGYRRWGHNEGDDPSLTQPTMYANIARHPTVRELWGRDMVRRGLVTEEEVEALLAARVAELQEAVNRVNAEIEREEARGNRQTEVDAGNQESKMPGRREASGGSGARSQQGDRQSTTKTGVPLARLTELNAALYTLPEGFTLHPRLERPRQRRQEAFGSGQGNGRVKIDWGHAEALAFATILADGTPIRLTGQDTERGTFSQRHVVLHDYRTGETYTPLEQLPAARADFAVYDSPLSEVAALGFEYGYSVQAREVLVLWEAQYGDFINAAQVIVDQFIVSGRAKWGQETSLVLLLPHAYEGQGPEHSSARLERFLELASEDNIRVANCTAAAQYFHLLRRQAALMRTAPRPLIVLTPKSLLRHPLAASPPSAFGEGTAFRPVLDDPFFADGGRAKDEGRRERGRHASSSVLRRSSSGQGRRQARRVTLCSGKMYVDLATSQQRAGAAGVALVRLEELYPFPEEELARVLDGYPAAQEVVWLQEEPRNMGAWTFVAPRLEALLASRRLALRYVGRPERASPAEGAPTRHAPEQARIVADAFA